MTIRERIEERLGRRIDDENWKEYEVDMWEVLSPNRTPIINTSPITDAEFEMIFDDFCRVEQDLCEQGLWNDNDELFDLEPHGISFYIVPIYILVDRCEGRHYTTTEQKAILLFVLCELRNSTILHFSS